MDGYTIRHTQLSTAPQPAGWWVETAKIKIGFMIFQALISHRRIAEVEESWPIDPIFDWNGETTGSSIQMDAVRFGELLRASLHWELQATRLSWGGDTRELVSRAPRFRNQAGLTLWLDAQVNAGKDIIELADFPFVVGQPGSFNDLIFKGPSLDIMSCLLSASCPVCGQFYEAIDLKAIEYDLFFFGEQVLACPRDHQLFVLKRETYQLGG